MERREHESRDQWTRAHRTGRLQILVATPELKVAAVNDVTPAENLPIY